MARSRYCLSILLAFGLAGCAAEPPTSPRVLALPQQGKNLAQFQNEDARCRGYAQQQASRQADSPAQTTEGLQQRYDTAYSQCMAASGNGIQQLPIYTYGYPGDYGPWFPPFLAFGFSAFPHHFHHHHHAFLHDHHEFHVHRG